MQNDYKNNPFTCTSLADVPILFLTSVSLIHFLSTRQRSWYENQLSYSKLPAPMTRGLNQVSKLEGQVQNIKKHHFKAQKFEYVSYYFEQNLITFSIAVVWSRIPITNGQEW